MKLGRYLVCWQSSPNPLDSCKAIDLKHLHLREERHRWDKVIELQPSDSTATRVCVCVMMYEAVRCCTAYCQRRRHSPAVLVKGKADGERVPGDRRGRWRERERRGLKPPDYTNVEHQSTPHLLYLPFHLSLYDPMLLHPLPSFPILSIFLPPLSDTSLSVKQRKRGIMCGSCRPLEREGTILRISTWPEQSHPGLYPPFKKPDREQQQLKSHIHFL